MTALTDPIFGTLRFTCGCTVTIRQSDLPVFAITCIHGGYMSPSWYNGEVHGSILIAENKP